MAWAASTRPLISTAPQTANFGPTKPHRTPHWHMVGPASGKSFGPKAHAWHARGCLGNKAPWVWLASASTATTTNKFC